jgi:hypothetical protein
MNPENPLELSRDAPDDLPGLPPDVSVDVPYHPDVLPDGRETVVIGDVQTFSEHCHLQGDNPLHFRQTCGLASCEGVLRQFRNEVTEAEIVEYAQKNKLCQEIPGDPEMSGGTTSEQQAQILSDYRVPAHWGIHGSVEGLAAWLHEGRGVIVSLDAGVFYNNYAYRGRGHAVTPIAAAHDPKTWEIQGFYVNDTGTGESRKFVDVIALKEAWAGRGGRCVVTDRVHQGNK